MEANQRSKGGFRTRKAAEAVLRERSASVDAGRFVERSTTTVGDYLDEWLDVVRPRLRPTSVNSYRQAVAHVKGKIGAAPCQSLQPLEVENVDRRVTNRHGRRVPRTRREIRVTFSCLPARAGDIGSFTATVADPLKGPTAIDARAKASMERSAKRTPTAIAHFTEG